MIRMLAYVFVFLALTDASDALALGKITRISAVGEPLHLEISAPRLDAKTVADCLRIAHPRAPLEGIYTLKQARLSLISDAGGTKVLRLTTADPMREPVVQLAIKNQCGAQFLQAYTLLLQKPRDTEPHARLSSSPVTIQTTPYTAAPPTGHWHAQPGDNLKNIAERRYPHNQQARSHFVVQVKQLNPGQFAGAEGIIRPLAHGEQFRLPPEIRHPIAAPRNADAIMPKATPRVMHSAQANRLAPPSPQNKSAQPTDPRQKTAVTPPQLPIEPAEDNSNTLSHSGNNRSDTPSAVQTDATEQDTLSLDNDEPISNDLLNDASLSREERIALALEKSVLTQLEIMARLEKLESVQYSMQKYLEATAPPDAANRSQTTVITSNAAASQHAQTPAWINTLLALSATLITLLLFLLWKQNRKMAILPPTPSDVLDEHNKPAVDGQTPSPDMPFALHDTAPQPSSEKPKTIIAPSAPPPAGQQITPDTPLQAPAAPPSTQALRSVHTKPLEPLEWTLDTGTPAKSTTETDDVDDSPAEEHDSAVELADIMVSFGRVQGAAETLAEFVQSNPRKSVMPWLKLMDVYRMANMHDEFDVLAQQLNQTFNVKTVTWENFEEEKNRDCSIESLPHIIEIVQEQWNTEHCQEYLEHLLRDNRNGAREGFPIRMIDEILTLIGVLEQHLGRYAPPAINENLDLALKAS